MIYLALGSNVGDRIGMFQRALRRLLDKKVISAPIRISSIYKSPALLPENAPKDWDKEFLNVVVEASTNLSAAEILKSIKQIETELGRKPAERWAPRLIDIDFLFDERQPQLETESLVLPHPGIKSREFFFLPLRELGLEMAPHREATQCRAIPARVYPSELVGVLNLTPDSFSDGNLFFHPHTALRRVQELVDEGASVIDIGAESTRPSAASLNAAEEWERLEGVLPEIVDFRNKSAPWLKLSLDSRHPRSMERALALGIDWINDVSGGESTEVFPLLKKGTSDFVLMHHLGIPADRNRSFDKNDDVIQKVFEWGLQRLDILKNFGIESKNCILDPGIGFGKTAAQSLRLIQNARKFREWNCRVMFGHSRKSFFQMVSKEPPAFRDGATAYVSAFLMKSGVDYIRVHSVQHSRRALDTALLLDEGG